MLKSELASLPAPAFETVIGRRAARSNVIIGMTKVAASSK
jgi:hypothetical protein